MLLFLLTHSTGPWLPSPCGAESCPHYPASPGDRDTRAWGSLGSWKPEPPPGLGGMVAACPAPLGGFWGPAQRDEVVGLSFGMLSPPLAVSCFL